MLVPCQDNVGAQGGPGYLGNRDPCLSPARLGRVLPTPYPALPTPHPRIQEGCTCVLSPPTGAALQGLWLRMRRPPWPLDPSSSALHAEGDPRSAGQQLR